jgi:predicted small integral membrane protein
LGIAAPRHGELLQLCVLRLGLLQDGSRRVSAVQSPTVHTAFYLSIIVWECVTTTLLWIGAAQMVRRLRRSAAEFHAAKKWAHHPSFQTIAFPSLRS